MCEICDNTVGVHVYSVDPTRTLTLRNAFVADMNRRFKEVAKSVTKAVVEDDCFGLKKEDVSAFQYSPGRRAFAFLTDAQKITSFINWLRQVEDAVILETQYNQNLQQQPWANLYLAHAFQIGTARALLEIKKAGLGQIIEIGNEVIINPVALRKLEVLFTRAFTDLRGITTTMDEQISRILAQGLFDGQDPVRLARMINRAIVGGGENLGLDIAYIDRFGNQVTYFMPGRRRAEILARTEIIRAHHIATIQEYRNWEIFEVYVLAEFVTARDERVCPDCASIDGNIYSLDEAEGLIPVHPQCRCVTIPYVDKTRTKTGGD